MIKFNSIDESQKQYLAKEARCKEYIQLFNLFNFYKVQKQGN